MVTTADDVEIDLALVERVKRFLTQEPLYVSNPATAGERIVAGVGADSRIELMQLEKTVARLIQHNEIMVGEPEPDDLNADPRRWSGPYTHHVFWVQ